MSLVALGYEAPEEGRQGIMVGPQKGTVEKAFAKRLTQALDRDPVCPPAYGRNTWLIRELAHQRVEVTLETIRKWLAGETMPRRRKMTALAKILRVDETWLAMGAQPVKVVSNDRVTALEEALREIEATTRSAQIRDIIANVLPSE